MNRMLMGMGAIWLSLLAQPGAAAPFDAPVKTAQGMVSGVALPAGIHGYLGLPFAAPPVGDLRWRAPAQPKSWTGVRKAAALPHVCMQNSVVSMPRSNQSEDCLYLNIWTGAQSAAEKRPVMVWIHGGGDVYGAATLPQYDGANLAKKGVVVVTIAYRIGLMGFLALPELTQEAAYHASGNYGELDQIAALKWVKANIAGFGGDPANVTVFGESAGSGDINFLQASPLAKGLFVRAIGESTSQMDAHNGVGWPSLALAEKAGLAFQQQAGAKSLADLRRMPADVLTDKQSRMGPVQDDGYLLHDTVYNIFARGEQNKVPVLVGANGDEGAVLHIKWVNPVTPADQKIYDALYAHDADKIRKSATDSVLWQMRSWIAFNTRTVSQLSYFYWFTHFPPKGANIGSQGKPYDDGPVHTSEIVYVFDNLQVRNAAWTKSDHALADLMSSYWTNFAKNGDPNGPGLPHWPAYAADRDQVMNFDDADKAVAFPRKSAVDFVEQLAAAQRGK